MRLFSKTLTSVAFATSAVLSLSVSAQAASLTIGLNFTGANQFESGLIPPDTNGAVGEEHIVELINGNYSVYSKSNGVRLQTSSLNQFWINAGVVPSGPFAFDPRVVYDPFSQRWFAASVDNARSDNNFLLAVSNSSNPMSGWTGFAIDSDSTNLRWADYSTLGFDRDGVYLAANMFPIADRGGDFRLTIVAVPKDDLLAASPGVTTVIPNGDVIFDTTLPVPSDVEPNALMPEQDQFVPISNNAPEPALQVATQMLTNVTKFENLFNSQTGPSIQPVVDLDNTGLPESLLSAFNTPAGFFKRLNITGDINSPTLNISGGFISVTPFNSPINAQQPSSTNINLSSSRNRFSSSLVLRNGAIWGVQTVENGGRSALRWFKIDANTNALLQEGLITDPNLDFYYSSLAVNEFNDVVIGFNGSSEAQFISSYAVLGETVSNVTTFGMPLLLKESDSSYNNSRWGDYSATVIDPTDPLTFWTFQEIVLAPNTWTTQITELKITPNISTVPEPASTLGVLAFGASGICLLLKRKHKS